jgi:hypothetical protein
MNRDNIPTVIMKKLTLSATIAILALSASSFADIQFGGSRAAGMGGAGLALPFDIGNNYRLNPAFLAFGSKAPTFQWPGLGYRIDGIGVSDVSDITGELSNGGLDANKIIDIGRRFGDDNINLALGVDFGLRLAGVAIGARGQLGINTVPNADLRNWANSGQPNSAIPATAQLDAYGFGYQQFEVGYGNAVRTPQGRFAIGVNTKRITGYFAHQIASGSALSSGNTNLISNGSNIPAGQDFLQQEGFSADVGLLYSPKGMNNLYIAAVIENFIEPGIDFDIQGAGTGAFGQLQPFKRAFSTGFGLMQKNLLLAADFIDLGNGSGRAESRYGAELSIGRGFAVRAGYNTRTAFTYGLSLGGLNIQVGGNTPLSLGTVFRF